MKKTSTCKLCNKVTLAYVCNGKTLPTICDRCFDQDSARANSNETDHLQDPDMTMDMNDGWGSN